MPLVNRVALITGGSRGIGRGIAVRLAREGARIAISYRSNKTAAQQALRLLQASGADCVAVETDVTDAAKAEQLVATVADRCRPIALLSHYVGWDVPDRHPSKQWGRLSLGHARGVLVGGLAKLFFV